VRLNHLGLLGSSTVAYRYDADTHGDCRLTSAATALGAVSYGVNALGQRYAKTLGGTTTVYLHDQAGKLIAEATPAGATLTEYVHLGELPVALFR